MKIQYNLTGVERKKLVTAISELLGTAPVYHYAPTFAYEIGSYSVDKVGTLTGADSADLVADLRSLHSLIPVIEEYDVPRPDAAPISDVDDHDRLTIELPLEGFTEAALQNLDRIIASKTSLIMKAIGADALPVERTETTIRFPWFSFDAEPGAINAYARFIGCLCAAAQSARRVTAREKPTDNEKFAMRVFLIRLGMVGDDYKASRRVLLKNLSGNSAFRNGAPAKKTEETADE